MGVTRLLRVTCEVCEVVQDGEGVSFLRLLRDLEELAWSVNLRAGVIHGTTVCPICVKSLWEDDANDDEE